MRTLHAEASALQHSVIAMHFASEASKYASMRSLHAKSPRNSLRLFVVALSVKHNIHN